MIPTYAILLYLSQIFCGGSYTEAQMDAIIQANQDQINAIELNSTLMTQINEQYDSMAMVIVTTNTEIRP